MPWMSPPISFVVSRKPDRALIIGPGPDLPSAARKPRVFGQCFHRYVSEFDFRDDDGKCLGKGRASTGIVLVAHLSHLQ